MIDLRNVYELAKALNLQNIAHGNVDLDHEELSNIEYLEYVLGEELNFRNMVALAKREQAAGLPHKEFDFTQLNSGVRWQLEQLERLDWIEEGQNLILAGKCRTGKTSLAAHLGHLALKAGHKVSYDTADDFLYIIRRKAEHDKQLRRYRHWLNCSVIILDDVMYTNMSEEDMTLFYRTLMLLNETRSIILVTNRELSAWKDTIADQHLVETLLDRISGNSQIIRLT